MKFQIVFLECAGGFHTSSHLHRHCVLENLREIVYRDFRWFLEEKLFTKNKVINVMQLSASWEVNSCAATEELPNILWSPKVHYSVHKSPPLIPILSQINPIYTTISHLSSFLILSAHLCLGLPSGLFHSSFPTNILPAFLIFLHSYYIPCPSHPPWLDHSTYLWQRIQIQILLYNLPITSSLFGSHILLSTLFSNTHSLCSTLSITGQVSHLYWTTGNIVVILIVTFLDDRPPLWSSGQSSWLQTRRPGFDSRHYQKKK
jgi:hypothetical protein